MRVPILGIILDGRTMLRHVVIVLLHTPQGVKDSQACNPGRFSQERVGWSEASFVVNLMQGRMSMRKLGSLLLVVVVAFSLTMGVSSANPGHDNPPSTSGGAQGKGATTDKYRAVYFNAIGGDWGCAGVAWSTRTTRRTASSARLRTWCRCQPEHTPGAIRPGHGPPITTRRQPRRVSRWS